MTRSETENCEEDRLLWQSVIAGDQIAFEKVVQKYQTAISSIAYSVLGNFSLAQEVTQESFWQAWRQRQALTSPERLAPWLCAIARNTAIQILRQEKRQHSDTLAVAADINRFESEGPLEADLIDAEEAGLVWSTIESLPEQYRETLVLFYREGQSVEEVARLLEISPEAVRQRLSRGREKLRDQMAQHVEDVLKRSRPGRALVRRIMMGIAALAAAMEAGGTAMAAGAGSVAAKTAMSTLANSVAKSGMVASAGIAGGVAGGLIGTAGGLGGAWLGSWLPAQMAPTQTERTYLEREGRLTWRIAVLYACIMLSSSVFLFLKVSMLWYFGVTGLATAAYTIWIVRRSILISREVRRIRATVDPAVDPNPSVIRQKAQVVMQKAISYRSQWSLFGLPLIDVQFGSPEEVVETRRGRRAMGWIACGDHATGLLFAYGGVARGLFALGGIAIGGVALGGLTVGVVSVGGCGLGVFSLGGLAVGWDVAGGVALGYQSAAGGFAVADHVAIGGFAIAREYAYGGTAIAREANTEVAKVVGETESFRWMLFWIINHTKTFIAIVVSISILPPLIHLWFRLKRR